MATVFLTALFFFLKGLGEYVVETRGKDYKNWQRWFADFIITIFLLYGVISIVPDSYQFSEVNLWMFFLGGAVGVGLWEFIEWRLNRRKSK